MLPFFSQTDSTSGRSVAVKDAWLVLSEALEGYSFPLNSRRQVFFQAKMNNLPTYDYEYIDISLNLSN